MAATKRTTGRKTRKGYLVTTTYDMGPFKTLKDANAGVTRVRTKNKRAVIEKPRKLKVGYKFFVRVYFFTETAARANRTMSDVKKRAPSANVKKQPWTL